MVTKYHFKYIWILWLMIVPSLIIDGLSISNIVDGDVNGTSIAFTIIMTFTVLYILRLTVFGINNITVDDDSIVYNYMFFRRKVLFSDIEKIEVAQYFNRHQLVVNSKTLIKHRIWLDYLNADNNTILADINNRLSKYNLIIHS
jgi:hypothetical protein